MNGGLFFDFRVLLRDVDKPASEHLADAKRIAEELEEVLRRYDGAALIIREVLWEGAARG